MIDAKPNVPSQDHSSTPALIRMQAACFYNASAAKFSFTEEIPRGAQAT
jgi:hypothetical protein